MRTLEISTCTLTMSTCACASLSSPKALRVRCRKARLQLTHLERAHVDAARRAASWSRAIEQAAQPLLSEPLTPSCVASRLVSRLRLSATLPLYRAAAVVAGCLGGVLVWSELGLLLQWVIRLSMPAGSKSAQAAVEAVDPIGELLIGERILEMAQGLASPLPLLLPLLWLRYCVGWALARIGVMAPRRLRGGHCTHSTVLLLDAASNCRLTMSLCYHFTVLLHATADVNRSGKWVSSRHQPSSFFCLFEARDAVVLAGSNADVYPPLCSALLFALATLYALNVYERLVAACAAASASFARCRRPEVMGGAARTGGAESRPAGGGSGRLAELREPLLERTKPNQGQGSVMSDAPDLDGTPRACASATWPGTMPGTSAQQDGSHNSSLHS